MAFQHLGAIRLGKGDVSHHHVRKTMLAVHRLQPLGLRHLFVGCAAGLDMDAADDLVAGEIADIVRRQIVTADLAIVAEEEILVVLVLLGRVAPRLQQWERTKKEQGENAANEEQKAAIAAGRVLIKDAIADIVLQQVLTRPTDFDVIATLNLNGDYLSDALAAQVGGIGIAPGGNINYVTGHAIFEATHGTAPKYAGKDLVNLYQPYYLHMMQVECG